MIPGLPYDHQLEYVESTGSQWIDTGLDFGNSLDFIIEMDTPTLANVGWVHQMDGSGTWLGTETRVSSASGGTIYYGNFNNNSKYSAGSLFDGTTVHHVVFDSKHGFYLDGVLKRSFTVSYVKDSISGVKLPLFTWYDFRAAAYDPNCPASKIMSFKVAVNGVLRANYIPVSVNGVAMMYDRVTGAFPKHYGTFVAGPVASTPLMGLHFYNQASTDAYLGNLYTAMWDGVENAGRGVHARGLLNWKDLVGSEDLIVNAAGVSVLPNSLRQDTTWIARSTSELQFQSATAVFRYNHSKAERVFVARGSDFVYIESSPGGSFGLSQRMYDGSGSYAGIKVGNHEDLDIVSLTVNYKKVNYFGAYEAWVNGVPFTIAKNSTDYNNAGGGLCIGARGGSSPNLPTGCEIFHLRFASRPMTALEVAREYAIDRMRFNIR